MIVEVVDKGGMIGMKACRRGPMISHLMFVDDLFGKAT